MAQRVGSTKLKESGQSPDREEERSIEMKILAEGPVREIVLNSLSNELMKVNLQ